MRDSRKRSTHQAEKTANAQNLARCQKLASEAKTPIEVRLTRLLLEEQEDIALALTQDPRGRA
jgi:hypothetical protein